VQPEHLQTLFSLDQEFTRREWTDLVVAISLFSHIIITGGFFCLTTLFYKGLESQREEAVSRFFTNKATPVVKSENEHVHLDNQQRILLGRTVAMAGIFVIVMMAIPNSLWGRLVFLFCGGAVFFVGVMLFSFTKEVPQAHDIGSENVNNNQ